MDAKHTAIVKNALKKLKTSGEPHPFFFAIDGENSVLHVDLKKGEAAQFGNQAKANKFLKKKGFEELSKSAKLCAGVVAFGAEGHVFSIILKKGASKTDLLKGLKELKGAIGLKKFSLGDVPGGEQADTETESETPTTAAPPPPAPSPDQQNAGAQQNADQQNVAFSPKKLEKFTSALGGDKPGSVPHDQLVQLQQQLASTPSLGDDALRKQVADELKRREKLVSQQASLAKGLTSIREGHARLEAQLGGGGDPAALLGKLEERLTKLKALRDQFATELR